MADPSGCPICGSTWGDHWEEVDGTRTFFCCSICARQYLGLRERIRLSTGWPRLDRLVIEGDRRGRLCEATFGAQRFRCRVAFDPSGEIRLFEGLDPRPGAPASAGATAR